MPEVKKPKLVKDSDGVETLVEEARHRKCGPM
jgi:hypothetical protein